MKLLLLSQQTQFSTAHDHNLITLIYRSIIEFAVLSHKRANQANSDVALKNNTYQRHKMDEALLLRTTHAELGSRNCRKSPPNKVPSSEITYTYQLFISELSQFLIRKLSK